MVADDMKWYRRATREHLFDLGEDPMEMSDRSKDADMSAYPQKLAEALGRDVVQAWRVKLYAKASASDVTWRFQHPDGLEKAWSSYDPRGRAAASAPVVERGEVTVHRASAGEAPAAVYVLPPVDDVSLSASRWPSQGGAPLKPVTRIRCAIRRLACWCSATARGVLRWMRWCRFRRVSRCLDLTRGWLSSQGMGYVE